MRRTTLRAGGVYVLGAVLIILFFPPRFTSAPLQPVPNEAKSSVEDVFTDSTALAGITERRQCKDRLIGQAWGDFNADGWLDLYLTDCAGPNILYQNTGQGRFEVTDFPEIALADSKSSGALFADYDNDGWTDLYVLNVGANALFRNEEGKGFSDATEAAGVAGHGHSKTAAWGDYDRDGFLDLYIANWSCSPDCLDPIEGDRDGLYRNNGDGSFTDVTKILGHKVRGAGFVASFVDYDNDGDLDIYLVNDEFINPVGNVLWRNDGPGCEEWCFTDVSQGANADTRMMGMGLATTDYDNDGDLDFYISNAGPMQLLQNQGDGAFLDMAKTAGVSLNGRSVGWGAISIDVDNDGWRDLYLALSAILPDEPPANPLFLNQGDGTFINIVQDAGLEHNGRTLGVAYGDYDNDGWVDLVIGNYDQGYVLYHNNGQLGSGNHRLAVDLIGGGPVNRDGIGARVYLTDSTERTQMQESKSGSSLGAGNALTLHFGLGQASPDRLSVVWPDGLEQHFTDIESNHRVILRYPVGPGRSTVFGIWGLLVAGVYVISILRMSRPGTPLK